MTNLQIGAADFEVLTISHPTICPPFPLAQMCVSRESENDEGAATCDAEDATTKLRPCDEVFVVSTLNWLLLLTVPNPRGPRVRMDANLHGVFLSLIVQTSGPGGPDAHVGWEICHPKTGLRMISCILQWLVP